MRQQTRGVFDAAAGPARGLLRLPSLGAGAFSHARREPAARLSPWVAHYWLVEWALPEGVTRTVLSAPHPAVHLVADARGVMIHGVHSAAFETTLAGASRVVGVKFRPGACRGLLGQDVARLRDRIVEAAALLGPSLVESWAGEVAALADEPAIVSATDALVDRLGLARDPEAELATALVAEAERDPTIRTVEVLARHGGLGVRSLQRLFHAHVGATPKWVVMRYRMHDLIDRLNGGETPQWASLAADLGYFDQSHLIGDFRRLFGVSPGEYVRRQA
jgi:AraC-like DNA-binding protein